MQARRFESRPRRLRRSDGSSSLRTPPQAHRDAHPNRRSISFRKLRTAGSIPSTARRSRARVARPSLDLTMIERAAPHLNPAATPRSWSSDEARGPESGAKGIVEDVKGKVKKAAGALTGRDELKRVRTSSPGLVPHRASAARCATNSCRAANLAPLGATEWLAMWDRRTSRWSRIASESAAWPR